MPCLRLALCCTLLCAGLQARAESGIEVLIRADSMQFDINTGNSVYRGNVSFTQGTIALSGDQISVNSQDGRIAQVVVSGAPARYSDTNAEGQILAESQNMDYNVANNQLSMQGTARLEQGDRVVQSQHILYDTEKQLILAGQSAGENADPEQRVNITLTPKKDRTP